MLSIDETYEYIRENAKLKADLENRESYVQRLEGLIRILQADKQDLIDTVKARDETIKHLRENIQ